MLLDYSPRLVALTEVSNSVTPFTVVHEASLSMRFPRQKYWHGLPFPSPWILQSIGSQRVRHDWSNFSSFQSLSFVWLFAIPWTAARQAYLSITNSQSLLKLMSIESVMPSNHLILCHPPSHIQSFPASGSFQMNQFFTSGGQSIEVSASASVLPLNIQGWFPLGWTAWISLLFKGLLWVFSKTTVQKHQFFGTHLSL